MLCPAQSRVVQVAAALVAALWMSGCAARPLSPVPIPAPPDLTAADRLVAEGCYACLQEALQIYRAAGSSARQFEVALLLAMREKELGLAATPWIDEARRLAASEMTPDTTTYLDIVAAQPWTTVAAASDFDVPRTRLETVLEWITFLTRPGAGSVLDRYLRLALVCSRPGSAGSPDDVLADVPVLQWTWYLGDAYYWRAWNLYQRDRVEAAAADVASAREFQNGPELLTLSGMVAYDQGRKVDARRDFEAARRRNPGTNCPALWYLGLINLDENMVPAARDQFAGASACYTVATSTARDDLANLPPDLSPEAAEQQRRDLERRIADNLRQVARAALNASLLSQQLADRASAEKYARIAVAHELTRDRAQAVLDRVQ
jgi:tetratricopeptide (TPR) repeat protein